MVMIMKLSAESWRRLLAPLGVAVGIAWTLSCAGNPSQPTPAPAAQAPAVPACSVRLWGCAASGYYGAIAYSSSTRASGIGYNYGTRAEAENSAIGYCGKSDCATVAWFQGSCGAIATAPTGEMATGTGTTGDTAQAFALASCVAK